jgi:hypothetical protein
MLAAHPRSLLFVVNTKSPSKQLQRTVRDKVPRRLGQRAAAELQRYTETLVLRWQR